MKLHTDQFICISIYVLKYLNFLINQKVNVWDQFAELKQVMVTSWSTNSLWLEHFVAPGLAPASLFPILLFVSLSPSLYLALSRPATLNVFHFILLFLSSDLQTGYFPFSVHSNPPFYLLESLYVPLVLK